MMESTGKMDFKSIATDFEATRFPAPSMVAETESKIFYLCPDVNIPSAGIRRLYRHVEILHRSGFKAFILHIKTGFRHHDMPIGPIAYLDEIKPDTETIFVIPEGMPGIMNRLKTWPGRRFVIALSWAYIFSTLPDGVDWRSYKIERVLTISPAIGRLINWSMGLPVHLLRSSINDQLYYIDANDKLLSIVYIKRKAPHIKQLKRLLAARNPALVTQVEWHGLDGLSEISYAAKIRQAAIFLNLSEAEGYPTSSFEAMASGTLVAGYDSVGSKDFLYGHGPLQNSILVQNGDYISLAYELQPILEALLCGKWSMVRPILSNALKTVKGLHPKNEAETLVFFWDSICSSTRQRVMSVCP